MENNQLANIDDENELIFSLDIGTRTVIGIVGTYEEDKFKILASEIVEHEKRTMYDGQIHDITGVSYAVKKVKETLEEKLDIKLKKVAIAAAGRALKTYRARIDRDIDVSMEISQRIIESLEMEAIQKAQEMLDNEREKKDSKYYCIGYTVVNYYLDGRFIENLEGHKGNQIGADVLATFLPHVVVDSLYTVMSRVDLEVVNITLEPIAAINVAIKKDLRLLNLALVDIGAGTSDIAITKDGTIVAYAMASVAGDEITENIAKKYLLDYNSAEELKIKLNNGDKHEFTDVVGINHKLSTEEILDGVEVSIKNLAKEITENIIKYNDKSPSAVFLIGGGSQIPRLSNYIASFLELPEERVVIRGTNIIENIEGLEDTLSGPQAITPMGIAMTAIENRYKDFLSVKVNGQKIKLFNSKQIKVSDALVLLGFNPRKLIPKKGKDFTYYINKEKKIIRGESGNPAEIYVNNKRTSLECKLKNGDEVKIKEATKGKVKEPSLYDVLNIEKVLLNDKRVNLLKDVYINDDEVTENKKLNDGDKIYIRKIKNIGELLDKYNLKKQQTIYKNGKISSIDDTLKKGDVIKTNNEDESNAINLIVNGEARTINYDKEEFVFIDIFNHIDFDLSKPKGYLVLKVNGEKADYYKVLKDGDVIEIYWDKNN